MIKELFCGVKKTITVKTEYDSWNFRVRIEEDLVLVNKKNSIYSYLYLNKDQLTELKNLLNSINTED